MFDTVDTIQVACKVDIEEAEIFLSDLALKLPEQKRRFALFVRNPDFRLNTSFTNIPGVPIGITAVNVYRHKIYHDIVYIAISVNPEMLCSGKASIRTFCCSEENVRVLQYRFAEAMHSLCPSAFDEAQGILDYGLRKLPYLGLLIAKRIDYGYNAFTDNKDLALKLLSASYLDSRKEVENFKQDIDDDLQDDDSATDMFLKHSKNYNLYAKNKTVANYVYDKHKKLRYLKCNDTEMLAESQGILRVETSKRRLQKNWIKKIAKLKQNANPYGILPYLDANIAEICLKKFLACIGTNDFYNDDIVKRKLEIAVQNCVIKKSYNKDGSERSNSQHKVIVRDILLIISQARSLAKACEYYISGGYAIAHTRHIVNGTKASFRKHVKTVMEAGVQPYRIPDRDGIMHFKNPLNNQVLAGLDNHVVPEKIVDSKVAEKIEQIIILNKKQHI